MEQVVVIILWVTAGISISAINIWLLHVTTNSILKSKTNVLLVSTGFLLRMVICAVIFGVSASGGHFDRFAGCVGGFLLTRMIIVNRFNNAYTKAGE